MAKRMRDLTREQLIEMTKNNFIFDFDVSNCSKEEIIFHLEQIQYTNDILRIKYILNKQYGCDYPIFPEKKTIDKKIDIGNYEQRFLDDANNSFEDFVKKYIIIFINKKGDILFVIDKVMKTHLGGLSGEEFYGKLCVAFKEETQEFEYVVLTIKSGISLSDFNEWTWTSVKKWNKSMKGEQNGK